ncbi:MAG: TRAP transporter substrate-binding protein DctP [Rhodospirillaceae bacterium]|jgi:TRAP-type C4-dicarboxylate transport system substrate-binding protein
MRKYLVIAFAAALITTNAGSEEVELTFMTAWNRSIEFAQDVNEHFVGPFNERAVGIAHIKYLGGPEVIPQRQMVYALRRGVVDMYFGAATYMLGLAPEADAFLAASVTPQQARANGGFDAIQKIWEEKLNAYFLGWHQTGPKLHIFTKTVPDLRPDGLPELTTQRIRTTPTYRAFLDSVGTIPVDIPSGEVYTALERGTVDAIAWTSTSMSDQGFQNFVKYRIDPGVLGLVMTLQMNLDRWRGLPSPVQDLLLAEALNYEKGSRARFLRIQDEEKARLAAEGMAFFELEAEAASTYTQGASDAVWARMARQVPDATTRLKPLFDPRPSSDEAPSSGSGF